MNHLIQDDLAQTLMQSWQLTQDRPVSGKLPTFHLSLSQLTQIGVVYYYYLFFADTLNFWQICPQRAGVRPTEGCYGLQDIDIK